MKYPPRISLAQTPTPLQPLRRLQHEVGGPLIWLKRDDLTGAALSGNKVRKLEFIAAKALEEGCQALITCGGTQSNHCRATAIVAAQLGMQCHLILRDDARSRSEENRPLEFAGNRLLDFLAGAKISVYRPADYFQRLDALLDEAVDAYAADGIKALKIPTGGSDATGVWGYFAACQELKQDFGEHAIEPQAIACATGSGGTQAGLTAGATYYDLGADVFGINVCDDEQYFLDKVDEDISTWQAAYPQTADLCIPENAIKVIDGYVGQGYGRINEQVIDAIKLIGRLEGVMLDPVYCGKAFAGLLAELNKGRFAEARDVIFVHTGGVFGLFPYAHSLLE